MKIQVLGLAFGCVFAFVPPATAFNSVYGGGGSVTTDDGGMRPNSGAGGVTTDDSKMWKDPTYRNLTGGSWYVPPTYDSAYGPGHPGYTYPTVADLPSDSTNVPSSSGDSRTPASSNDYCVPQSGVITGTVTPVTHCATTPAPAPAPAPPVQAPVTPEATPEVVNPIPASRGGGRR